MKKAPLFVFLFFILSKSSAAVTLPQEDPVELKPFECSSLLVNIGVAKTTWITDEAGLVELTKKIGIRNEGLAQLRESLGKAKAVGVPLMIRVREGEEVLTELEKANDDMAQYWAWEVGNEQERTERAAKRKSDMVRSVVQNGLLMATSFGGMYLTPAEEPFSTRALYTVPTLSVLTWMALTNSWVQKKLGWVSTPPKKQLDINKLRESFSLTPITELMLENFALGESFESIFSYDWTRLSHRAKPYTKTVTIVMGRSEVDSEPYFVFALQPHEKQSFAMGMEDLEVVSFWKRLW